MCLKKRERKLWLDFVLHLFEWLFTRTSLQEYPLQINAAFTQCVCMLHTHMDACMCVFVPLFVCRRVRVRGCISLPSTFCIDFLFFFFFFTDIRLKDKPLVQQGCPHSLTHYSFLAYTNRSFCWNIYTLRKVKQKRAVNEAVSNTVIGDWEYTPVKQFSKGEA